MASTKFNFKFVLDNARGKYFMWAADDDERAPDCIAQYLRFIGNAGGVFSNYAIRDYLSMLDKEIQVPKLSGNPGSRDDLLAFLLLQNQS